MEVVLGAGGEDDLHYAPLIGSQALTELLFELNHYVDVGIDGGAVQLGNTTITQPPTVTGPNQVTSAGHFPGSGGTVSWTAVSSIAAGATTYVTTLTFTSGEPFGALRVIQYMDGDVDDLSNDNLAAVGTFGQPGFRLVTVSPSRRLGPAQQSPLVTNATCPGWAASPYSDLRDLIEGAGTTYAPTGHVINLPTTLDPRFGQPAWGPADMTSAVACDLSPGASTATVTFSVSVEDGAGIPTLGQWATLAMVALLTCVSIWRLRRGPATA